MFSKNRRKHRLKMVFVVILLLFANNDAFGAVNISGAFGMKLGQKFKPSSPMERNAGYKFHPKNPFRSFSYYYVFITPKTHLVYRIFALGSMNSGSCRKEKDLVMSILEEKYGRREKTLDRNSGAIMRDSRSIGIVCHDSKIVMAYSDENLEKQAEKERINFEIRKLDSTGL